MAYQSLSAQGRVHFIITCDAGGRKAGKTNAPNALPNWGDRIVMVKRFYYGSPTSSTLIGLHPATLSRLIHPCVIFHKKCDWVDETSNTYSRILIIKNATARIHSATGLILSRFNATE